MCTGSCCPRPSSTRACRCTLRPRPFFEGVCALRDTPVPARGHSHARATACGLRLESPHPRGTCRGA
eukprot:10285346-Alexandrium_andersonii.AAC.1